MILNVISDIRNGRRSTLVAHLESRNIPYRLWDAVMLPGDTVASINASHKQIVRWAKEGGQVSVAIAEDDVFFPAEDGWYRFVAKRPKGFDMYLAGCYSEIVHPVTGWNESPAHLVKNSIIGLHCYIIHDRYYNTFLSTPDADHIDTAQTSGTFKVCYPFAAIQAPGFSANSRQFVDLNVNLKPEDVYGGLPKFDSLTGAEAP